MSTDYIKRFCATCKFRNDSGQCTSPKIEESMGQSEEQMLDMLVYSYLEGGCFYVGDKFGCVHHEEKD